MFAVDVYNLCAGPFAIVAGASAPAAEGSGNGDGAADSSTIVTSLAPPQRSAELEHSMKFFTLALGLFEGHLGASFPLPSYHQAS